MKAWLIIALIVIACVVAGVVGFQFLSGVEPKPASVPKKPPADVAAVRSKAEAGDAAAQAQLGQLYARGEGVTNSYSEAAKWFSRAADQTNSAGLLGLGELCEAGQGVPKDMAKAVQLYRRSAELGNPDGEYTLAFMYESGRGVRQSQAEAAKWYQRAAEHGQPLAQYDLGQRYNLGVGLKADKVEALKWLILAADQDQPDAASLRDKVKKELSSSQVEEARRRAAAFNSKTAASR
ncbi:MAG TPA: tetratricopeptide repeat protein [Patescibacteria group bacterium]|nr:tetratricopeptide repeat protein [Patescibacteria group bacterium]